MSWTFDALGDSTETAKSLARQHNLVCSNGEILCWACKEYAALLPSLHCPQCLTAAWDRLGLIDPQCPQREQTDADKMGLRNE